MGGADLDRPEVREQLAAQRVMRRGGTRASKRPDANSSIQSWTRFSKAKPASAPVNGERGSNRSPSGSGPVFSSASGQVGSRKTVMVWEVTSTAKSQPLPRM